MARDRKKGGIGTADVVSKRSVVVGGTKTSVSLETDFWDGIKAIANEREQRLEDLVTAINAARRGTNLSSALRLYVLRYYRDP